MGYHAQTNEDVKKIDESSFRQEIKHGVVLVDFYADWCGPCRMLSPVLEKVATDMKGKAVVAKVNVDSALPIARENDVRGLPTMILYKEGKEVGRLVGLRDEAAIKEFISSAGY